MANQPAPQPTPKNSRPYDQVSWKPIWAIYKKLSLVGLYWGLYYAIYIGIIVNYDKDQVFNGK